MEHPAATHSLEYKSLQTQLIQKEALIATKSEQYEIDLARSEVSQYDGVSLEIREEIEKLAKERELKVIFQKTLETSEGGLYIGATNTLEPDGFFSGLIDDIRLYNIAVSVD